MQQSFSFKRIKAVVLPKGAYNFLQSEVSLAPLLIDRLGDPTLHIHFLFFLRPSFSFMPAALVTSFSLSLSPQIVEEIFLEQA